ncbi:MAG: hypothetical protein WKF52_06390 [Sphingomicrobium sp.]
MDRTDISNELRAIKVALEDRSAPTITGGQLFALIRSAAPDLDIRTVVGMPKGSGALTEFIRMYLSDVVERIGNQGGDILHRIMGREVATLPPSASSQIWRTFVSPNSSQHLVLSISARRLLARDTSASTAEGDVEVAKASPDEHDRMRADFAASLPEPAAAVLREQVASDADFESWIVALREHLPETTRQWGYYRRRRLSELFAARITGLELEDPLQRAVLEQIRTAEFSAYEKPRDAKAALVKQGARQTGGPDDATDATSRVRRLAHAAVDLLAYDELRALRMPLGAMLDAIRAKA